MNTALLIVVLVALLFSANASDVKDEELVDYRLMVTNKQLSPFFGQEDCSKDNVAICQDCNSIGICVTNGNGGWNVIAGGKCAEGETCRKGVCSKAANPACATNLDFICTSTGMFPNQEDCKRYHFCVKNPATVFAVFNDLCTDHYAYNSKTTYCSKKINTNDCTNYPVPLCKTLGEMKSLSENSVLYSVCIRRTIPETKVDVLYPVIYSCEHGRSFDNYAKKCRSK